MTKHVVSNQQCVHMWAQRPPNSPTGEPAWARGSSVSFQGKLLKSYATTVAAFVEAADGSAVALFSSNGYSHTTHRHLHFARRAVSGVLCFDVPTVAGRGGWSRDDLDHSKNLTYLVSEYEKRAERLMHMSADTDPIYLIQHVVGAYSSAIAYARLFALPEPIFWCKPESAERQCLARLAALNRTPERLRRIKEREAREAAALAKQIEVDKEARAEFRAGSTYTHSHVRCEQGGALLAIVGDKVITSWGAEVPLADARRAFSAWRRIVDANALPHVRGNYAQTDAETQLGHFTLDSIDSYGNITAGCHIIYRAELERFGALLGASTS